MAAGLAGLRHATEQGFRGRVAESSGMALAAEAVRLAGMEGAGKQPED